MQSSTGFNGWRRSCRRVPRRAASSRRGFDAVGDRPRDLAAPGDRQRRADRHPRRLPAQDHAGPRIATWNLAATPGTRWSSGCTSTAAARPTPPRISPTAGWPASGATPPSGRPRALARAGSDPPDRGGPGSRSPPRSRSDARRRWLRGGTSPCRIRSRTAPRLLRRPTPRRAAGSRWSAPWRDDDVGGHPAALISRATYRPGRSRRSPRRHEQTSLRCRLGQASM